MQEGARLFWVNGGLAYDELINENFFWALQFGECAVDEDEPDRD